MYHAVHHYGDSLNCRININHVFQFVLFIVKINNSNFLSIEITEKLFKTDDDDGTSLPSLNIQRGRDHGLPGKTASDTILLVNRYIRKLQTTNDFPIHLSYKTGYFEALYEIPESSTTSNNHFPWTLLITFHYEKIERRFFTKVFRTMATYERHVIQCYQTDNRHVNNYIILDGLEGDTRIYCQRC